MPVIPASRRGPAVAMSAAMGLVVLYVVTVLTVPGQRLDDHVLGLAQELGVGPWGEWLPLMARTVLPRAVVAMLVLVGAVAVLRRWWPRLAMAAAVVLVSVPSSFVLRQSLPRPDHGYSYVENTLPSTHVTVVAAGAVAILLLWPTPRPQWLAAALGSVVGLACVGNVVGHAHRPGDVVASVLLVVLVAGSVWTTGAHVHDDRRREPIP